MKPIEEVAIVGAGPAGAYCAFELAKQGLSPVILDHSHPREKPCGGGISPPVIKKFSFVENFRPLGFSFGNFKIISCIDTEILTKQLENGFSISRRIFDEAILNMAIDKGARLIKQKVNEIEKKGNIWKIKTDKMVFSTKVIVGADGVNSLVRNKTIGPISKDNLALTFGYLARPLEKDNAIIKFLAKIPGYIWVFPGKGYSNVGIGSELKEGSLLKALLDDFIKTRFPSIRITSKYASLIPSASNPKFFRIPCAGKDWILIGDAAGHVDPISGGGILYALWGGQIAAKAIINKDTKSFDSIWRKEYGRQFEERCKRKDAFYDPQKSVASMIFGLSNSAYFWAEN
jgi:geranylgeranyl reductase family protein